MQSLNQVLEDKRYNVNNNKLNNVKRYNVNAEKTAKLIAEKLHDENSFLFFCKVAHQLPENVIWRNLEQAQGGKNPRAYFTFLCKLEMGK